MVTQNDPGIHGHFPGGSGLAGTRISPFWLLLELRVYKKYKNVHLGKLAEKSNEVSMALVGCHVDCQSTVLAFLVDLGSVLQ